MTQHPFMDADDFERERLRALRDYGVLDTPPDPVFDDLTDLAAQICETPISLVSLVDASRQWFKSHRGLSTRETPRSISFCAHTIRRREDVVIVPDAQQDPRFARNPLVTSDPHIRYYAAAPLRTPEGFALGTLCVMDRKPRVLSTRQLEALQILARQAMSQLELRRALHALQRSEERFECVARAVSDVVWDWDLRTGEIWWSDSFRAVFGHDAPPSGGGADAWARHIHPDDRDRVLSGLDRAIHSQSTSWRDEYRFRRGDGTHASIHDRAQIVRDETGAATRVIGGKSDVTERKQLESQYLRAQRMESIGSLAGGIAHDLNNVLTPILMSVSMLESRLAHDPNGLNTLHILENSAVRGAALVRQVLSFARGVEGAQCPTSVAHVLTEAVRLAQETFPRSITLNVHVAGDLWAIKGDATHLHQVFMNLLVNARDAMPGGGTLFVSAHNEQLPDAMCRPFKRAAGPYVVTSIRDTGVGIPAEIIDRIFEPFFTTKAGSGGTGLGLATVHGIVATHGGFVRVRSTSGLGSTFQVCLPAIPDTSQLPPDDAIAEIPAGSGEMVMLVDDEAFIRSVATQTLSAHGYRVITAENGREALGIFAAHATEVRVVVIDLMMPVMDGAVCAMELRRLRPEVALVAASGVQREGDTSPGLFDHFLAKPYTAPALLGAVRQALETVAERARHA